MIVGVGGIGGETARLCSEFGMTVLGVDPRLPAPSAGVSELHRPDDLLEVLPRGDFVIVTVPETPETQGMFGRAQFRAMKSSGYFINIGRGATVILDDLVDALRAGEIAGAGLDVFQIEPLPAGHPLWSMPGVLITPHVAGNGPISMTDVLTSSSTTANDSTKEGNYETSWTKPTGSDIETATAWSNMSGSRAMVGWGSPFSLACCIAFIGPFGWVSAYAQCVEGAAGRVSFGDGLDRGLIHVHWLGCGQTLPPRPADVMIDHVCDDTLRIGTGGPGDDRGLRCAYARRWFLRGRRMA